MALPCASADVRKLPPPKPWRPRPQGWKRAHPRHPVREWLSHVWITLWWWTVGKRWVRRIARRVKPLPPVKPRLSPLGDRLVARWTNEDRGT